MDLPADAPARAPSSGRAPRATGDARRTPAQTPYYTSAPIRTPRTAESPRAAWRPTTRVASRRMHSDISSLDIGPSAPSPSVRRTAPATSTPMGASRPRSNPRRAAEPEPKTTSLYDSIMSVLWPSRSRRRANSAAFGHEAKPARLAAREPPTPAPAARMPFSSTPMASRPDFSFANGDTSAAEVSASIGYGQGARLPHRSAWSGIEAQTLAEADAEEREMEVDQDEPTSAEASQSQSRENTYALLSQFFQEKAMGAGGSNPLTEEEWAGCKELMQQCYSGVNTQGSSSGEERVLPSPAPPAAPATRDTTSAPPASMPRPSVKTTRDPPTTRQTRKVTIFTLPGQRRRATTAVRAMGARVPSARTSMFTPYRPPGVYGAAPSAEPVAKRPRLREVEDDAPAPTPVSLLPPPAPEKSAVPSPSFHPGSTEAAPKPKPAKRSLVASTLKDMLSENPLPDDKSSKARAALTNPYAALAGKEKDDSKAQEEAAKRVERMLEKQKKALKQRHAKKRATPAEEEGQDLLDLIQQTAQQAKDDKQGKRKRSGETTDEGAANGESSAKNSPTRRQSAHWTFSIPRHSSPLKHTAVADSSNSIGDESSNVSAAPLAQSVAPPSEAFTFAPPAAPSNLGNNEAAPSTSQPTFSFQASKAPDPAPKSTSSFGFFKAPESHEQLPEPSTRPAEAPAKPTFSFQTSKPVEPPAKPTFSFQTSQPAEATAKPTFSFQTSKPAEAPVKPTFTFQTSKSAEPLAADAGDSDKSSAAPKPAFSFRAAPVPAPTATAQSSDPKEEVLKRPLPALPVFDFGLPPSSGASTTRSPAEKSAIQVALSTPADKLPLFQFDAKAESKAVAEPAAPSSVTAPAVAAPSDQSEIATKASGGDSIAPGAGEEGETTLGEARVKAIALVNGEWHNVGVGMFRVKQSTEAHKTRALMRSEGNGNVLINFALWPEFRPEQDKLALTFLGFDQEGKPTKYRLRVKTAAEAETLASALLDGRSAGSSTQAGTAATPAAPAAASVPAPPSAPVTSTSSAAATASADAAAGSATNGEAEGAKDEEDTGVVVDVRTKVYKRSAGGWENVGVGRMKVTVLEGQGQARLLLRSEPANHVLVNFRLYHGLEPKWEGKLVSFLGFEGKEPMPYRVRVMDPADGEKLAKAIKAHVPSA